MQGTALVSNRQDRSVLKLSLGVSLAIFVVMIAVVLLSGASAEAASVCNLTSTIAFQNWSALRWNCVPTQNYPGLGVGDTAIIGLNLFTMNVDVVTNPVVLQATTSNVSFTIAPGAALN